MKPPTELGRVHLARPEFDHWPIAAVRVLRAMAEGKAMDTPAIEARSAELGEPITYSTARGGVRFLVGGWRYSDKETLAREWGSGPPKAVAIQQLTAAGVRRANLSLSLYPPRPRVEGVPERSPAPSAPPDPSTPLWRVLTDTAEVLVIAASAPDAIALYEQETGESAHRAVAVDTTAPVVLGWSTRERKSD